MDHAVMLKSVPLCKGHKLVATPLLVAATHFSFGVAVSALYCYATRKSYFLPCLSSCAVLLHSYFYILFFLLSRAIPPNSSNSVSFTAAALSTYLLCNRHNTFCQL